MRKYSLILAALLAVAIILPGVLYLNRADFVQDRVRNSLEKLTGTAVEMDGVEVKGLNAAAVKNIRIMSPRGYEQKVLAVLKEIELDFDGWKYISGQGIHFSRISFILDQAFLERHEKGNFNLRDLAVFVNLNSKTAGQGKFFIDRLEVTFGKAVLYEHMADKEPLGTEVDFASRKEVYGKITDPSLMIFAPALKIIPEFKRGNMGIPRTELQKKLSEASGFQRS